MSTAADLLPLRVQEFLSAADAFDALLRRGGKMVPTLRGLFDAGTRLVAAAAAADAPVNTLAITEFHMQPGSCGGPAARLSARRLRLWAQARAMRGTSSPRDVWDAWAALCKLPPYIAMMREGDCFDPDAADARRVSKTAVARLLSDLDYCGAISDLFEVCVTGKITEDLWWTIESVKQTAGELAAANELAAPPRGTSPSTAGSAGDLAAANDLAALGRDDRRDPSSAPAAPLGPGSSKMLRLAFAMRLRTDDPDMSDRDVAAKSFLRPHDLARDATYKAIRDGVQQTARRSRAPG